MKFDPYSWKEVKPNEEIKIRKGRLQLRCSAPSPLFVSIEGVQALAGYGTSFDVQIAEAATVNLANAEARVFMYDPESTAVRYEGEVYTNIDRMPHESGMLAEVTRARRMFQLEQRAALREMRLIAQSQKAAPVPPAEITDEPPVTDDQQVTE